MRRAWITTVSLVSLVSLTAFIDGCVDDGVGEAPEGLFTIPHSGDAAAPAASATDTQPASTAPNTGTNSGPPPTDAGKKDVQKPPPPPPPQDSGMQDTGVQDTGSTDTGSTDDAGMMDASDDGG